jgi:hypothetical protein
MIIKVNTYLNYIKSTWKIEIIRTPENFNNYSKNGKAAIDEWKNAVAACYSFEEARSALNDALDKYGIEYRIYDDSEDSEIHAEVGRSKEADK